MSQFSGRAWVFGDDINTDLLAPGAYMKFGIDEIARHCMEAVDPSFAVQVRPGDIVFGGRNFGAGSSREQAVEVLRMHAAKCPVEDPLSRVQYLDMKTYLVGDILTRNGLTP